MRQSLGIFCGGGKGRGANSKLTKGYPRQIAMARAEGAVADGKVVAFDLGIAMPVVVASQMGRQGITVPGPDSQITAGAGDQPFAIPATG